MARSTPHEVTVAELTPKLPASIALLPVESKPCSNHGPSSQKNATRYLVCSDVVDFLNPLQHVLKVDLKILEQTVMQVKDPAVNNGIVVFLEALLDGSSLDDVTARLNDIQLNETLSSPRMPPLTPCPSQMDWLQ